MRAPSYWASYPVRLRDLWTTAGFQHVEIQPIKARRSFDDFESFWSATSGTGRPKASLASLGPDGAMRVKARLQAAMPPDKDGRISYAANANAIRGQVPG